MALPLSCKSQLSLRAPSCFLSLLTQQPVWIWESLVTFVDPDSMSLATCVCVRVCAYVRALGSGCSSGGSDPPLARGCWPRSEVKAVIRRPDASHDPRQCRMCVCTCVSFALRHLFCLHVCVSVFSTTSLPLVASLLDVLPAGLRLASITRRDRLGAEMIAAAFDCCPAPPAHLRTLLLPVSALFVPSNQKCYADEERLDRARASDCSHLGAQTFMGLAESLKVIRVFCPGSVRRSLGFTLEHWRSKTSEKWWCSWEVLCYIIPN